MAYSDLIRPQSERISDRIYEIAEPHHTVGSHSRGEDHPFQISIHNEDDVSNSCS